ncbi:MAG TPA: hypothetical protein VHG51_15560 [Longimicrobiaceae bacterium]|nr:hypothetical protein [Longimicrobiaceae bacterium]
MVGATSQSAPLSSASALGAQSIPSSIRYIEPKQSFGVSLGYLFTNPAVEINDTQVEFGPQSAPMVDLRYQIRLSGPLSGEVRAGFSPSKRRVYEPTSEQNPALFVPREVGTQDMALVIGEAGLVFHLTGPRTWNGLAPFVAGTGGVVTDLNRGSDLEEDFNIPETALYDFGPGFAIGLGLGTDWFPTRRLSVRLEARDRFWQIETPQGLANLAGERDVSEWTHNFSVNLGAALHF